MPPVVTPSGHTVVLPEQLAQLQAFLQSPAGGSTPPQLARTITANVAAHPDDNPYLRLLAPATAPQPPMVPVPPPGSDPYYRPDMGNEYVSKAQVDNYVTALAAEPERQRKATEAVGRSNVERGPGGGVPGPTPAKGYVEMLMASIGRGKPGG